MSIVATRPYIVWHEKGVETRAAGIANERLRQAAEFLADAVQANIGTPGPPHSVPGEYPHMITGQLHGGIRVTSAPGGYGYQVRSTAPHSKPVEAIRPFLERTFRENRSRVRAIILGRGRA